MLGSSWDMSRRHSKFVHVVTGFCSSLECAAQCKLSADASELS